MRGCALCRLQCQGLVVARAHRPVARRQGPRLAGPRRFVPLTGSCERRFPLGCFGRCVAQTLAVQARCVARRRRSPSRTRRSTRPAVPSAAFSTTADSSMSLLAPARRRARTATMSHKFSCLATHRSFKEGRWVSLASCYLLARFVSPFRASNVLHSFDAQMMVKNSFLEIVVISTLSLMRRAWIITVTCYSSAGYIPGLPLTRPPVAGHFKLCVRMRHLHDVDGAASKYDACFNNLSHSDEKPAN